MANKKRKTGFEEMVRNIQSENKKEEEIKPISFDPNEEPKKRDFVAEKKKNKSKEKVADTKTKKEEKGTETKSIDIEKEKHLILKDDPENKGKYTAEIIEDDEELDDEIDFDAIAKEAFSDDITERMKNVFSGKNELTEEELIKLEELKAQKEAGSAMKEKETETESKSDEKEGKNDENIIEAEFVMVDSDSTENKNNTDAKEHHEPNPEDTKDQSGDLNKEIGADKDDDKTEDKEETAESEENKNDESKKESDTTNDNTQESSNKKEETKSENKEKNSSSSNSKQDSKSSIPKININKIKSNKITKEIEYASIHAKSNVDFIVSEIGRNVSNVIRNIKTTPWW